MRRTPHHSIVISALALSGLSIACSGDVGSASGALDCTSASLAPIYDAALSWSAAVGEAGSSQAGAPSGLGSVESGEAGQCALAGVRQGLEHGRKRRSHKGHHDRDGHCDHGGDATCKNDGRVTGEVAANLYCDLAVALGQIGTDDLLTPGPEDSCSNAFEKECRKQFDRVAKARPDCAPFLGNGDFADAFKVARFNQCLFSIGTDVPPPDPHCDHGECECRDEPSCAMTCTEPGCEVSCEHTDSCTASCGDDCDASCKHLGTCSLQTGHNADIVCEHANACDLSPQGGKVQCRDVGNCTVSMSEPGKVSCERAGNCDIDCPECDVSCKRAGTCRVKLAKGRVKCDHTGSCEVICADNQPPTRCKNGSFVCGESCH